MVGRASVMLAVVCFVGLGCARFRRLEQDTDAFEHLAVLDISVEAANWSGRPLVVVVMVPPERYGMPLHIERTVTLTNPDRVRIKLEPGHYVTGAYEDLSGDARWQPGEPVAVFRDMQPFAVGMPAGVEAISLKTTTEVPEPLARLVEADAEPDRSELRRHEGTVASLADARFDPEHAKLGVWQPLEFVKRFGAGIFMLGDFDPGRIPVLFVHGMGGHPREFEALVGALDRERFQPWVAFYPSGFRLGLIANTLEEILRSMQARLGFEQLYLVAHSMGGLVSRALLTVHAQRAEAPFIARFVTLSSPLGGIASADKGVEKAPSVVPSWRDIGPASTFVRELYATSRLACVDYTLLFAYGDSSRNEASDGVVPVSSQLREDAQLEADREAGYETTHVGILRHERAVRYVMRALTEPRTDTCRASVEPIASVEE